MSGQLQKMGIAASLLSLGANAHNINFNAYATQQRDAAINSNSKIQYNVRDSKNELYNYVESAKQISPNSLGMSNEKSPTFIFTTNEGLDDINKQDYKKEGSYHQNNEVVVNLSSIAGKNEFNTMLNKDGNTVPDNEEYLLNHAFQDKKNGILFTALHEKFHADDEKLNHRRNSTLMIFNQININPMRRQLTKEELAMRPEGDTSTIISYGKHISESLEKRGEAPLSLEGQRLASNMVVLSKESYADGGAAITYLNSPEGPPIEQKYAEIKKYADIRNHIWLKNDTTTGTSNHWTTQTLDNIIEDHKKGILPKEPEKINEYLNAKRDQQVISLVTKHATDNPKNAVEDSRILLTNNDGTNYYSPENPKNLFTSSKTPNNYLDVFSREKEAVDKRGLGDINILDTKLDFSRFVPSGSFSKPTEKNDVSYTMKL